MATHPDYPGATSRVSKGKTYWRYRAPRGGKDVTLPGNPGDEIFDLAYAEATRKRTVAELLDMPGRAIPFSFGKAARLLEGRSWWIEYDDKTKLYNGRFIERFLNMQVEPGVSLQWREVPVEAMKRKDLHDIIMSVYTLTPHTGRHFFNAIKKLITVAIEEQWIEPENDPGLSIKLKKPPHIGEKAWPHDVCRKFEQRHPIGSSARTCYILAKHLGNRRGDLASLSWDDLIEAEVENDMGDLEYIEMFEFRQSKNRKRTGGKLVTLPLTDTLAVALAPLKREPGKTVLQRQDGEPYSEKSLTTRMAEWTEQAGLPAGYTLHGLRKTFAAELKASKASAVTIRDAMGHSDLATTQVYLANLDQRQNAAEVAQRLNERDAKRQAADRRAAIRVVK